MAEAPAFIENRTFAEIRVGDAASLTRTLRAQDISLFAAASGDVNPAHLDRDAAATDRFHGVIAHGLWGGSLISAVLGTELPGPGTVYPAQSLRFLRPVRTGDAITARVAEPKAAILSAVETVATKLGSTLDAAALCKMAERGQITGGCVDGPLAFDTAASWEAARAKGLLDKGLGGAVAGDADILVAPDLVSGNMLAKQLIHLAGAEAAGLVLGARVPIVLTSRADGAETRAASCALAQLVVHEGGTASPGAAPCPDTQPAEAAA